VKQPGARGQAGSRVEQQRRECDAFILGESLAVTTSRAGLGHVVRGRDVVVGR
jgi:hypothetical protein